MSVLTSLARGLGSTVAVPDDVRARAALQHLSTAAALLAMGNVPPSLRGDARDWADTCGRAAASEYDDFGFWGPASGAVPAIWSAARGHSWGDVLSATATATEVGARLGTWTLLQGDPSLSRSWLSGASTAFALGRLRGLGPDALADALSLSLNRPLQLSATDLRSAGARASGVAAAVAVGAAAVDQAERSDAGDPNLLDSPDGLPGVTCWHPLPVAWSQIGEVWLSRAVTFRLEPVAPWALTAVQGFHEILRRHVKAASKRLRVDQVERIEVVVDHFTWMRMQPLSAGMPDAGGLPFSIAHLLGALVSTYDDGPALLDPRTLAAHAADIEKVAALVEIRPDVNLTVARLRGVLRGMGPLFSDVPRRSRLGMARQVLGDGLSELSAPPLGDLAHLLRGPIVDLIDQLLERGPAGLPDPMGLHLPAPVAIKLYTTRGGWWPERRDVIEGGPEYGLAELRRDVVRKYARCAAWTGDGVNSKAEEAARDRATRFLSASEATDAAEILGLLAP